jgi:tetratricopeptide (TPR) repeat protein
MDWLTSLGWVRVWLSTLEPKDITTLIVSSVALVVSVTSVLHSVASKKREGTNSAQTEFAKTVEGLLDVSHAREDLRRTLGDDWGNEKHRNARNTLDDKRQLLLSTAVLLLNRYRFDVSDIAYAIVGTALIDSGMQAESLAYYKRAVDVASNALNRARALRVYGRALILAGDLERGRAEMLLAAADFEKLQAKPGHDDEMRSQRVIVFERMIRAAIQLGEHKYILNDYHTLVALEVEFRSPDLRKRLRGSIKELNETLVGLGLVQASEIDSREGELRAPINGASSGQVPG